MTNGRSYIRCERSTCSTKQTTTSKKSTCQHSELCSFRFIIKYDSNSTHNQMYIRQNSGYCLSYNGHTSTPFDKRTSCASQLVDKDLEKVRKFIEKLSNQHNPRLCEFETGHNLSAALIQNFRRTVLNNSHAGNVDMTPAGSLLHYLESFSGLEYKTLTGPYDEATDCVTVHQKNEFSGKRLN